MLSYRSSVWAAVAAGMMVSRNTAIIPKSEFGAGSNPDSSISVAYKYLVACKIVYEDMA